MIAPPPDIALAERLFAEIAAASADPPGVTRDAYGPGEDRAHAIVATSARALGLTVETDVAGNLYATLQGADPTLPKWVAGSHLDSVPHGGDYDGTAGVLAALAVAAGFAQAGVQLRRSLVVMAIRAEETPWFPASYIGSRAALGRLRAEELALERSDTGASLAEHMRRSGADPDALIAGPPALAPSTVHSFLELHIEQGPVLEAAGIPVGLATGIVGSLRHRAAQIVGAWGHSGTTPRRLRADTVFAFAELAAALEAEWDAIERGGGVATLTIGRLATDPGLSALSKIAGRLGFTVDARSADSGLLDRIGDRLDAVAAEIAARRGVDIALGARTRSAPAVLDAGLRTRIATAAARAGIAVHEMPSGAGHDAAAFASAGIPSALIFVRNQNGSHCPEEAMRIEDFAAGALTMAELVAGETS